jgi:mRNA-degrading endonuclease RelE of RelBE toxin-antitoxin system
MTLSRNRKSMRPNALAGWELRVGDIRVLYNVVEEDEKVEIVAIGVKVRSKLLIDGEEVNL